MNNNEFVTIVEILVCGFFADAARERKDFREELYWGAWALAKLSQWKDQCRRRLLTS